MGDDRHRYFHPLPRFQCAGHPVRVVSHHGVGPEEGCHGNHALGHLGDERIDVFLANKLVSARPDPDQPQVLREALHTRIGFKMPCDDDHLSSLLCPCL